MTQVEKQELINALCGYLPYKCKGKYEIVRILESETKIERFDGELDSNVLDYDFEYENFKPYLRPMSSMTEEEKDYIKNVARFKQSDGIHYDDGVHYVPIYQETLDDQWKTDGKFPPILDDIYRFMLEYGYILLIDFFNSHHLDYRGLIPKGLAIEAPKDMYK